MILYENGSTKGNAEGTTFTINDTSNGRTLKFYKYEGQTTQTGTPTPSSPQPINVVTGNNTIDIVNSSIPNGYTRVDYIQSNGTEYIDTNVIPTSNTKINLDFEYIGSTYNGWTAIYGERGATNTTYFALYINSSTLKITVNYAGLDAGSTSQTTISKNTRYNVKNDGGQFYLDNVLKTDQSTSNTLVTSTNSMYLFDMHLATGLPQARNIQARIYQCKFYEGDTLIRDYIPCFRNSDNVVGLYDLVNNVFYTNLGGGAFTYGNIVDEYQSYEINLGTTELCKIGNYVDEINKSSGKNLFDKDSATLNKYLDTNGALQNSTVSGVSDYIDVTNIDSLYLSYTGTNTGTKNIAYYNSDKTFQTYGTYTTSRVIDTTIFSYIRFTYVMADDTKVMLSKGTTALDYEPYGTSWYIKKNIGKVVLNGSEDWEKYQDNIFFVNTTKMSMPKNQELNAFSNNYSSTLSTNSVATFISRASNLSYAIGVHTTATVIRIKDTRYTNLNDLKTWLSNNNTILYYVLANPTYTIITDNELVEQLEALENATTYDNQTNVLQTNSGLPLYTYVEYIQPLDFSRNGLGVIPNVLNAKVVDEINGEYSLTFEYPMSEPMATELVEDRIVKCKVADGTEQCFIIKTIQKSFDKMSVYCTHLFYLLYDNFLEDTYPQNLSPKPFLDHILSRANYQLPFTTTSDISTTKTARYVRKNCVEAILGDIDNSMFNLFGMELKRDNWNIGLKARLGSDKGEKLIFGKNITGVDVNIDTTGVYTRIMPIGFDGLLLPEKYVDADNIDEYPYPRICLYEFPDIVYDPEQEGAYHNLEDAYQALRDAVNELYANGINKPLINISVNWVELSKTEEYKQYSALERVDLGDTLTCNLFGMDYTTRVIKTEYNPLTDRIDTFEIGTFQPNIATSMNKIDFDVTQINPSSILEQAQENATSLITQAMGGYVYKTNSELYIMDNEDPNQAVHVWRWNINGLGYSSTGINGNYGLAMTMDGSIVADFITTGHLNTSVIEGYDSIVQQVYATDNDLQDYKNQVSSQFTQTANTFEFQFNNLNTLIDSVSNTEYTHYQELNRYIRFVNGVIILGEEGNPFTVELSNTRLSFKQDGTEVAYVSNNKLYITSAEVLVNEKIGNFEFRPRNNGSLSFGKVSE